MLKNSVFVPCNRFMLGEITTMANRAMARPQLIESLHLCKAQKARRSHEWLVGLHTVWHGLPLMWQHPLSMSPFSFRLQETLQVLPIQVTQICIQYKIFLQGTRTSQLEYLIRPPDQGLQHCINCILYQGHKITMVLCFLRAGRRILKGSMMLILIL